MKKKKDEVSIVRAISKLGFASRTKALELIHAKKVKINGVLCLNPKKRIRLNSAKITIEGELVEKHQNRYFIFHKPKSVITSAKDEKGRKTIFDYFKEDGHFFSVGRLDFATSGLLLITNDTKFSDYVCDPKNKIQKTYHVTIKGKIDEEKCKKIVDGILIDDELHQAESVVIRKSSQKQSHLFVNLCEGKNREIRKMFSRIGHEVTALKRISIGKLVLGDLELGKYQEMDLEKILILINPL